MSDFPAMSGTWYSQVNIPCHASASTTDIVKSFWFNLKTFLCNENVSGTLSTSTGTRPASSNWVVVSSSNGVSHGATDYWGTVYNGSNFVSASSGASHSWCILKNVQNGYHVLLDLNTTTATSGRISFASGAIAGGALSSPATTSETFIVGATGDSIGVTAPYWGDVTIGAGQHYMHFTINANGEFMFLISRSGQNMFHSMLIFVKLISEYAIDRNYVSLYDSVNSGRGVGRSETITTSYGYSMRRTPNGSLSTGGGVVGTYGGGTHLATVGIDAISGKYNTWPMKYFSTTPQIVNGGSYPDLYWVGAAQNCASIPSTSAQQWILANGIAFPLIDVVPNT